MSEPTIYKPSIYNGNGVYKNGAAGGGGESWRDWYDELDCLGYKISTVRFQNSALAQRFNLNCKIISKHTHVFGSSISNPALIHIYSNQSGTDNWQPSLVNDGFLSNHNELRFTQINPWNISPNDQWISYHWTDGMTLTCDTTWTKNRTKIDGILDRNLTVNTNSSWKPSIIDAIYNGSGNSQMYFYYLKIYDENEDLVMEFLPVKRKVDGVLGVLETKSGLFASGSNLSEPT